MTYKNIKYIFLFCSKRTVYTTEAVTIKSSGDTK